MVDARIRELFKNALNVDVTDLGTSIGDLEAWDSFGHMKLIVTLEKKFDLKLTFAQVKHLRSVNIIQEFLWERGVL
jgi:acyl carrier protein